MVILISKLIILIFFAKIHKIVTETNTMRCIESKRHKKNFPIFLTFLSSLFETFLMRFSFSTFPGTKFLISGHFMHVFGHGKLWVALKTAGKD